MGNTVCTDCGRQDNDQAGRRGESFTDQSSLNNRFNRSQGILYGQHPGPFINIDASHSAALMGHQQTNAGTSQALDQTFRDGQRSNRWQQGFPAASHNQNSVNTQQSLQNHSVYLAQMAFLVNNPQCICFNHVPHMHHLFEEVCEQDDGNFGQDLFRSQSQSSGTHPSFEKQTTGQSMRKDKYLQVDVKSFSRSQHRSGASVRPSSSEGDIGSGGSRVKPRVLTFIKYRNGDVYYGQVKVEIQEADPELVRTDSKGKPKKAKTKKRLIRHGLGKFVKKSTTDEDKDGYEYIGTFKNDLRHGLRGTCFYENGDFYSGPWRNDQHDSSIIKILNKSRQSPQSFTNAILIQNGGADRFIGSFDLGQYHGNGMLYKEQQSDIGTEISIYTGKFSNGLKHGQGRLQTIRCAELASDDQQVTILPIVQAFEEHHRDGEALYSAPSADPPRLLGFPQMHETYQEEVTKQFPRTIAGVIEKMNEQTRPATCLEEIDSYTKINELVGKYPRIDKEWTASKQVSQWLFAIRMPHDQVINKFVTNNIDGYALLMLDKNDLVEMLMPHSQTNSSTADENFQEMTYSGQGQHAAELSSAYHFTITHHQQQRNSFGSQPWNGQSSAYPQGTSESLLNQDQTTKRKQLFRLINKIAHQIHKLRIIWVKTLSKMRLIEEYEQILQDMGIIVGEEDYLEQEASNAQYFTGNMFEAQEEPQSENLHLAVPSSRHPRCHKSPVYSSWRPKNLSDNVLGPIQSLRSSADRLLHSGNSQKPVPHRCDSLLHFQEQEVNKLLNGPRPKEQVPSFETHLANCIRELDIIHGFFIPISQINDLRPLQVDAAGLSETERRNLEGTYLGTYLHGLKVCLKERHVRNSHHVERLLEEVRIIKDIRHPGVIMHLGVAVLGHPLTPSSSSTTGGKDSIRFFLVSEDNTQHYNQDRRSPQSLVNNEYSDSNPLATQLPLQVYISKLARFIRLGNERRLQAQQNQLGAPSQPLNDSRQAERIQLALYRASQKYYEHLFRIFKQIVQIVKYLHSKSIRHGALHMSNFIIELRGLKIMQVFAEEVGLNFLELDKVLNQSQIQVKIVSLQTARYLSTGDEKSFGSRDNTTEYLANLTRTNLKRPSDRASSSKLAESKDQLLQEQIRQRRSNLRHPARESANNRQQSDRMHEWTFSEYREEQQHHLAGSQQSDGSLGAQHQLCLLLSTVVAAEKHPIYCQPPEALLSYNFLIGSTTNLSARIKQSSGHVDDDIDDEDPEQSRDIDVQDTGDREQSQNEQSSRQQLEVTVTEPDTRLTGQSHLFRPHFEDEEEQNASPEFFDYQQRDQNVLLSQDIYQLGMLAFDLILEIYEGPPLETFSPEQAREPQNCVSLLCSALFASDKNKQGDKKKHLQKILRQKAFLPLQKHLLGGSFEKQRSPAQVIGMQAYFWTLHDAFTEEKMAGKEHPLFEGHLGQGSVSSGENTLDGGGNIFGSNVEQTTANWNQMKGNAFIDNSELTSKPRVEQMKEYTGGSKPIGGKKSYSSQDFGPQIVDGGSSFVGSERCGAVNLHSLDQEPIVELLESTGGDSDLLEEECLHYDGLLQHFRRHEFLEIDSIHGKILQEVALKCTRQRQSERYHSVYAIQKQIEKFEKYLNDFCCFQKEQVLNMTQQKQQARSGHPH